MSTTGATTQSDKKEIKPFDPKAMVSLKSAEDEKIVNHAKLKAAFMLSMSEMLAIDAYNQWEKSKQVSDESDDIVLLNGASQVLLRFTQDGLEVSSNHDDEKSLDIMLESVKRYQHCYAQHHKPQLDFVLTCHNEEEAEKIIQSCAQKNIKITSLLFYSKGASEKPIAKDELLQKIRDKLGLNKRTTKSNRPS